MNHGGCGQTIDEVSGTPTMLEKHQWAKCTGTPSMCTGTPEQKSGSGQSVPVHLHCVSCIGTPEHKSESSKSVPVHH